ncbi:hypothetical protein M0R04_14650 [Candidatus Dojkabacteria bacterium]|jgi:hypothetical protein|nr:hypothetical protein [Candidatus Dojkabacteria bacterium]
MNFQDIFSWIMVVLIIIGAIVAICYVQVRESECKEILHNKEAYWEIGKYERVEPGYTSCCVSTYINHIEVDSCEVVKR